MKDEMKADNEYTVSVELKAVDATTSMPDEEK